MNPGMRMLLLFVAVAIAARHEEKGESPSATPCVCPVGPTGPQGRRGERGPSGDKGGPGIPGVLIYRGSPSQCPTVCPPGPPGDIGTPGIQGESGRVGMHGPRGPKGIQGDPGVPGRPGMPGLSNENIVYLPYIAGNKPEEVCYSFQRSCYVPGLRNGWRAWHRKGSSGFMVYNKWMYYVTLSKCPCKYNEPELPQPVKPSECRYGTC